MEKHQKSVTLKEINMRSKISTVAVLVSLLLNPIIVYSENTTKPIVERTANINALTYEELKAIFTLSVTRWTDGGKITVVVLPENNPIQRRFLWEYLGLSPARYSEIIDSKTYSGKAYVPIVLETETDVIRKIKSTRGSIGFVGNTVYVGSASGFKIISIR